MTATLESIGTTLGLGVVIMLLSVIGFGMAVRKRSVLIAPRALGRPRNVIYNQSPTYPCQDRGSPTWGWIPWTLSLSYDTMLHGVPGTGTRNNGLSGYPLKVNMDGIVLLRLHLLGLRITAVATFLFIPLLLPLYFTAQCYGDLSDDESNITGCQQSQYNLTSYEKLTIANVPATTSQARDAGVNGSLARLYMTSICFFALVMSTLYFLKLEWVQILAMRRVYYLEKDIWKERRDELQCSLFYDDDDDDDDDEKALRQHFTFEEEKKENNKRRKRQKNSKTNLAPTNNKNEQKASIGKKEYLEHRDPWVPHPEQRDTVPNISLYSLLVGGLPSLPAEALDDVDTEAAIEYTKRFNCDWQLGLAATFFDHCVPNQPGYSSSVAAVTIIPGSKDMSLAWRKWYAAASKLRRLRFIRRQINELRHYDIGDCVGDGDDDEEEYIESKNFENEGNEMDEDDESKHEDGGEDEDEAEGDDNEEEDDEFFSASQLNEDTLSTNNDSSKDFKGLSHPGTSTKGLRRSPRQIYSNLERRNSYFRKVLGSSRVLQEHDKHVMSEAVVFGPEQASVYSREFAQAAAACCPNGCREGKVRKARIDELLEMLHEAEQEVHIANLELKDVRNKVTYSTDRENSARFNGERTRPVSLGDIRASKVSALDDKLDLEANMWEKSKLELRSKSQPSDLSVKSTPELSANSIRITDQPQTFPKKSPITCDVHSESSHTRSLHHMEGSRNLVSPDWQHVQDIVNSRALQNSNGARASSNGTAVEIQSGTWVAPSISHLKSVVFHGFHYIRHWIARQSVNAVDSVARESTYAIVTFTSRQAAVAARNCLADGRGQERWISVRQIPIPPLADAPPMDLASCRNCLRPVSISITQRQKNIRSIVAFVILFLVYTFYTIPLGFAQALVSPDNLVFITGNLMPFRQQISGLLSSGILATFFSTCPLMFKAISNFGSGAVSVAQAELRALQYYWWFMLLTAFSASLLANMFVNAFNNGFGNEFRTLLVRVADTVPTSTAFTWLNWIILRFTITLPVNYLLTVNSFLFSFLGLPCCARAVTGGGPGGPTPYRIYVDTCVVLLCIFTLAPASPLVAPAGLFYFLVSEPLFRRNLIFMYRPKFDAGGTRWIFIFDMITSSITMGIVLLAVQLALKSAIGPAIVAAAPIVPLYMYNWHVEKRIKPAFRDAALLQTSLLDGWDTSSEEASVENREEFRRFLVDAHKAAYVPVCLTGPNMDSFMTAEPAIAIPLESETKKAFAEDKQKKEPKLPRSQPGATLRRSTQLSVDLLRLRKTLPAKPMTAMQNVAEPSQQHNTLSPLQEPEKAE